MTSHTPLLLAVAPNGARYLKKDHPALPISAIELAHTAVECHQAGARMFHLHVRDDDAFHSISPTHYLPAIKAVKAAIGDQMLIQVTSESSGKYNAKEQMQMMLKLMPDCLSIALRELIPSIEETSLFQSFIHRISDKGCLIQYILYDETDFKHYNRLVELGTIPEHGHSVLFVLGRYTKNPPTVEIVEQYRNILLSTPTPMVCTFGANAHQILVRAIALGCHVRLGFENGFTLPDGNIAKTNAEIVTKSRQLFSESGRSLADIKQARIIMGLAE